MYSSAFSVAATSFSSGGVYDVTSCLVSCSFPGDRVSVRGGSPCSPVKRQTGVKTLLSLAVGQNKGTSSIKFVIDNWISNTRMLELKYTNCINDNLAD